MRLLTSAQRPSSPLYFLLSAPSRSVLYPQAAARRLIACSHTRLLTRGLPPTAQDVGRRGDERVSHRCASLHADPFPEGVFISIAATDHHHDVSVSLQVKPCAQQTCGGDGA
ncbi:MAG: hypothetical protein RLZZ436_4714 [Planctomycetota bacterium]